MLMDVSQDSGGKQEPSPSEMSVMCGQLRWFQLLAELRLLQLVEVGPGADMGCRKSREPETRNE